jgi:multidrug transporter EmrE-like cation transporter
MEFRLSSAALTVRGTFAAFGLLEGLLVFVLIILNQVVNVGATTSFALSGHADRLRTFVFWQLIGGFFGLGIQVTFAGLVRYWSVGFANAVGIGLAFVSAQVFSAYMIFNESFGSVQWFGTALVFVGVLCIAFGHH